MDKNFDMNIDIQYLKNGQHRILLSIYLAKCTCNATRVSKSKSSEHLATERSRTPRKTLQITETMTYTDRLRKTEKLRKLLRQKLRNRFLRKT